MISKELLEKINTTYLQGKQKEIPFSNIVDSIIQQSVSVSASVENKVIISNYILKLFSEEERVFLCKKLLIEQVSDQRKRLNKWGIITAQSSQIDTGYIAQHLVSLRTQIAGQGMRGKGDDLSDGSEIKSANFLDSLDKKGATAPRWNFTAISPTIMENFLTYSSLYLLTMDLNKEKKIRIRIWKMDVTKNLNLIERYQLWMKDKGYIKFSSDNEKKAVNFQLFPPKRFGEDNFARHGNGRKNGHPPIKFDLNDGISSRLIFKATQHEDDFEVEFL